MATSPSIEFFAGISESLDDVSLRQDRSTGDRVVLMSFRRLRSIERFQSYTKRFNSSLMLRDEEGDISVQPDSVQFVFGGPEGDDLARVDCKFTVASAEHWERFMRFMHRYAAANGMAYGESGAEAPT